MIEPQSAHIGPKKRRILVFCDFYLPSRKSGGGMWTVANLVDRFCDRYDFFIVTRNYDSRTDTAPYTSVVTNDWNEVGPALVMYLPNEALISAKLAQIVEDVMPDGIFLNSFFSTPCVKLLIARRRGFIGNIPVVLAPCGELSPGAVELKRWKKYPFIAFSKAVALHRDIIWKASTDRERTDIQQLMGRRLQPFIAPDLPPREILPAFLITDKPVKNKGSARLIFLSRISRKKNLRFLLERLSTITDGFIELTIAGPAEDVDYFEECRKLVKALPPNITVRIVGAVHYDEGLKLLTNSHFFVLPTLNENFGYVMLEAMSAGCPLLISDRTVWGNIINQHAGWVVPLGDPAGWESALRHCIYMDSMEYEAMAANARKIATDWLSDPAHEEATAAVLIAAYGS
jgi:glycosyltransferase involved in cell wall biosynthesis